MKIWRYMDLAKFISLISTKSIYFANSSKFADPYELDLPSSHYQVLDKVHKNFEKKLLQHLENIPNFKNSTQHTQLLDNMNQIPSSEKLNEQVKKQFGISCWHINDYENEALWKIYTNQGQGIAIESTYEQLKKSFITNKNVHCEPVRYEDFDTAQIEKGINIIMVLLKEKRLDMKVNIGLWLC